MLHDPKTGKIVKKGNVSTPADEDQVEHELDGGAGRDLSRQRSHHDQPGTRR